MGGDTTFALVIIIVTVLFLIVFSVNSYYWYRIYTTPQNGDTPDAIKTLAKEAGWLFALNLIWALISLGILIYAGYMMYKGYNTDKTPYEDSSAALITNNTKTVKESAAEL